MKIEARSLSKRFSRVWALVDISFSVDESIVAILGPNGSGKTTLLTILAGLRYPSSGRVTVNGIEPYVERDKAANMISFLFEKPRFNLSIRVKDLMEIVMDERNCFDEAREYAQKLGIHEFSEARLSELSFGQAQLVGLWSSLACWKGVVLLDEPFAHLDPRRAGVLIDIMREKGNVVFATHNLEEAEFVADYIIILDRGRLTWAGSKRELFSHNVFEVYPMDYKEKVIGLLESNECRVVADMGSTLLVADCDSGFLAKLLDEGYVIGFRRAGVRSIYASSQKT
ncbi:MAG: ABC transporter ATP-binding protein [Desulfurococcaceae archaeon]